MTTRAQVAAKALGYNGLNDGTGYPGPPNIFEQVLGRPDEYWCGDFVSAVFAMCGLPLPVMQAGMESGFASVPMGWEYAVAQGATSQSWNAEVGDLVVFSNEGIQLAHVELVYAFDGTHLYSIGGDSGPSNVDGYQGQGGVHRHESAIGPGVGNPSIVGVITTGHLVTFTKPSLPEGRDMILVYAEGPAGGAIPANSAWEYGVDVDEGPFLRHVTDPARHNVLKLIYGSESTLTPAELNELGCLIQYPVGDPLAPPAS
jgi:hypothetical protein